MNASFTPMQNYVEYNGNGNTTVFTIPFYFLLSSEISVQTINISGVVTDLVNGIDFSVAGEGLPSGGTCELNTAYGSDNTIRIYRNASAAQKADAEDSGEVGYYNGTVKSVFDNMGEFAAERFGVVADGTDVGANLQTALTWIATNGGTLILPKGEINIGISRLRVDWFSGIKPFKIMGNKSVIVPENLDPPSTIAAGKYYQSEASIFVFTADAVNYNTGYLPPVEIEGIEIDYRKQRNKGGATFATMGDSCHPTPFSDGMYGIYFARVLRPVVRNCIFRNIYGDGIIFKRCADFELRNCSFYDVSANQILRSDGNTASDHRGSPCMAFACTGVMDNNFAHNTRTYTVDVVVDGVNVNGTLCGYIGFSAEYTMNYPYADGASHYAAPLYPWYYGSTASTYSDVNADAMIVMTNNRVYGYTIGLKAEASADVAMIGNRIFNCYIPVASSTSSTTIENNWIDNLPENNVPQSGFSFYRACIMLADFGSTLTAGMMAVVRNNRIFTKNLSVIAIMRNDAVIDSNQVRISGSATLWKQQDSKSLRNIKITNNVFRIMRDSYTETVQTSMTRYYQLLLSGNRFINETSFSIGLVFNSFSNGVTTFDNNHFDGMAYVQVGGKSIHKNNRYENTARLILGTSGNDYGQTIVEANHFECLTSMINPRISLGVGDARVRNNTFNLTYDSDRTIIGLISCTGSRYNLVVSENRILENAATQNFALLNAGEIHNLIFENNYGSGGRGYFLGGTPHGPFTVTGNIGFGSGIMTGNATEPNKEANLSPSYTPSIGSRLPYLRPLAGGAEGIVYTSSGWKEFGSIAM